MENIRISMQNGLAYYEWRDDELSEWEPLSDSSQLWYNEKLFGDNNSFDGSIWSIIEDEYIDPGKDEQQLVIVFCGNTEKFQEVEKSFKKTNLFTRKIVLLEKSSEESGYAEEFWTSDFDVVEGEDYLIENKTIHIECIVHCYGNLIIKNCVVYYNKQDKKSQICLSEKSNLKLFNTTLHSEDYGKSFLIIGESTEVLIDSCTMKSCEKLIYLQKCSSLVISNNLIEDSPFSIFKSDGADNVIIEKNRIILYEAARDLIKKYKTNDGRILFDFDYSGCKYVSFCNNLYEERGFYINETDVDQEYYNNWLIRLFSCKTAVVEKSSFLGLTLDIKCAEFRNSKIERGDKFIIDAKYIANSMFIDSNSRLSAPIIAYCHFIRCNAPIISDPWGVGFDCKINYCKFLNCVADKKPLLKFHMASSDSYIKNCLFDGISIIDSRLVSFGSSDKPKGLVEISDCTFESITSTKSTNIIQSDVKYCNTVEALLGKSHSAKTVIIKNCTGLDRINKEGNQCEESRIEALLWTVDSNGDSIGSDLEKEI